MHPDHPSGGHPLLRGDGIGGDGAGDPRDRGRERRRGLAAACSTMICALCAVSRVRRPDDLRDALLGEPRFCPRCLSAMRRGSTGRRCRSTVARSRQFHVYDEENADHHLSVLPFDRLGPLFLEAGDWIAEGAAVVLLEGAETAALRDLVLRRRGVPRRPLLFAFSRRSRTVRGPVLESSGKVGKNRRSIYKHHNSAIE
ncbi:MAG: hypothetical protein MZU97_06975 [Bacillus subtilis]|nr:hypothetical protein [Bacillus subtilis]